MIHNSRRLVISPLKGTPNLGPMSLSTRRLANSLTSSSSHPSLQSSSASLHDSALSVHRTRSHTSHPALPQSSPHVRPSYMPVFEDHAMYIPKFPESSEPPIPTRPKSSIEPPISSTKQVEPSQKRPASSLSSVSDSCPVSIDSSASTLIEPPSISASRSTNNASLSLPPTTSSPLTSPSPPSSSSRPMSSTLSSSPSLNTTRPTPSNISSSALLSELSRLSTAELSRLPTDERAYLVALQSISNPEELARFLNFAKAWVKVGKKVPESAGWVVAGKLPLDDSLRIIRSTRQFEIGRVPSGRVAQVLLLKLLREVQNPRMVPPPVKSMAILERIYNLWSRSEDVSSVNSSPPSPSSPSEDPSSSNKAMVSFVEDPLSWALLVEAYSLILRQDQYPSEYNFIEREHESSSSSTFGIKENFCSLRNYKLEHRLTALGSTWSTNDARDEEERVSIERVVDNFSHLNFIKFERWFDMFKQTFEAEGGIWTWRYQLENMVLDRVRSSRPPEEWTAGVDVNRLTYPCLPSVQSRSPLSAPPSPPPSIEGSSRPTTLSSPPRLAPLIESFHISFNPNFVRQTTPPTTKKLVSDLRAPFLRYPSDPILLLFAFRLAFRISPSDPDRSTLLSDLLSRVKPPVSWKRVIKLEDEGTTGTVQRKRRQWARKVVKEGLDELGGVLKGRSRLWEDLLNS